ncbi:phage tail assembly chaperone [Roseibium aestuarii]|uniref:phage tail assembly chaperone n=1 Tax=Roseibium aestuarii TaxID=2600299 RepID=UPI003CC71C98
MAARGQGWTPQTFWSATLRELALVLAPLGGGGADAGVPMRTVDLNRLARRFPDGSALRQTMRDKGQAGDDRS